MTSLLDLPVGRLLGYIKVTSAFAAKQDLTKVVYNSGMIRLQKLSIFFRKYRPVWYWLLMVLIFLGFWLASYTRLDPDFGWHLQAGRYIWQHWVPAHDIFTYTATDFAWINHEWLNDIMVAGLHRVNYGTVAAFFALVWTGALVGASRKRYLLPSLIAAVAMTPFLGIRPVAWGVLFLVLLERILGVKDRRWVWALPFLMLAWSNLHGSFVLGLVIVAGYQVFAKRKLPWLCLLASFVATFINPYGWQIYIEIARTMFDTALHGRISEWRYLELPWPSVFYVVCLAALHFGVGKHVWRRLLSLPGLLLVMSLSSIRHFPLFAVSSLRYFEDYTGQIAKMISKANFTRSRLFVISTLLGVFFGFTCWFVWRTVTSAHQADIVYPQAVVSYLNANPCQGNIFNSYNYGGFLVWQLPQQKVYIDGRMPSWKEGSTDYFKNYLDFLENSSARNQQIAQYNIGCVVLDQHELTTTKRKELVPSLEAAGWHKIPEASNANTVLMVRP